MTQAFLSLSIGSPSGRNRPRPAERERKRAALPPEHAVRQRDSLGIEVEVDGHALDADDDYRGRARAVCTQSVNHIVGGTRLPYPQ